MCAQYQRPDLGGTTKEAFLLGSAPFELYCFVESNGNVPIEMLICRAFQLAAFVLFCKFNRNAPLNELAVLAICALRFVA